MRSGRVTVTPIMARDPWVIEYEANEHLFFSPGLKGTEMKVSDSGSGDFVQAPVGNHPARCIKIIDIGTQEGEYAGKPTYRRQIVVMWELPTETFDNKEGKAVPFVVSKWYTASLSEKANLRADLVNWRGRPFTDEELMGFEVKNILGKPCMVQVTHNDKQKAKVTAVSSVPKGFEVPAQVNPSFYFSLEKDEFKQEDFDQMAEFFQNKIKTTPEWAALHDKVKGPVKTGGDRFADFEDDLPF